MNTHDDYVMDLAAEKIIVLDLDDTAKAKTYNTESPILEKKKLMMMQQNKNTIIDKYLTQKRFDDRINNIDDYLLLSKKNNEINDYKSSSLLSTERICLSYNVASFLTYGIASSAIVAFFVVIIFICRQKYINSIKLGSVNIGSSF